MHCSEWEAAGEELAGTARLLLPDPLCDIQRAETYTGQVRYPYGCEEEGREGTILRAWSEVNHPVGGRGLHW
jgi:hypothetical protein